MCIIVHRRYYNYPRECKKEEKKRKKENWTRRRRDDKERMANGLLQKGVREN